MSTPRCFIIRCKCGWAEVTTGLTPDLAHLTEVTQNCPTCGKLRQFRCPKCQGKAKMYRIKPCC